MTAPIEIDVFSDIACPWCLIGKRRLQQALEQRPGAYEVRWHAYQLQPDLPAEGVEAGPWFEKKFGGKERLKAIFERVATVGRGDGIAFDFEGQKRAPNTRLGHRVIQLAQEAGKGAEAAEALFQGHFVERADISNLDVICALLEKHGVGLELAKLRADLSAGAGEELVDRDLRFAREAGISGVPFFIANGRIGLSGAQEVETFVRFLDEAAKHDHG